MLVAVIGIVITHFLETRKLKAMTLIFLINIISLQLYIP